MSSTPVATMAMVGGGLALRPRSWVAAPLGALLFACTMGFGLLAASAGDKGGELAVLVTLSQDRSPALTAAALLVHRLFGPVGGFLIWASISGGLLLWRRLLQAGAFASVTAVGWLSSELGKAIVGRPRPPADAVHALVAETRPDSFPSGHTAFAFSLALAVFLVLAKTPLQRWVAGVAGLLLTCGVAVSRVYLGVHYPSDTVGAVLTASATVLVWLPVWNRIVEPWLLRAVAVSNRPEIAPAVEGDAG